MSNRTIFVGNLPGDVKEREIEDLFYKYGPIVEVDLKLPPRPPGYCFIEFEDPQDAEDAIKGRDGYKFDGHRLRVEFAHGGRGPSSTNDHYSSYTSGGGNSARSSGAPRRTDYRVIITGLPSSASWQDLKDHMRKAGDVCYAQVFRDRGGTMGIADYTNYEDMKYAIRKLDDSEFRNLFSRSYIRVREDRGSGQKRSYSRSHSYSRSPSRSRSRSRAPQSKSRSQSPSRPRSRSVSPPPRSRRPASRSRSASPRPLPSRSPKRSVSPGRSPSLSHSPSRSPPAKAPERSLSPASSNGD